MRMKVAAVVVLLICMGLELSAEVKDTIKTIKTIELDMVSVLGRKETGYNINISENQAIKAMVKELPISISGVTKELIEDRGLFSQTEISESLAGMTQNSSNNDIIIRGFRSYTAGQDGDGFRMLNGMRVGFNYFTNPNLTNIEQIEVYKGPMSVLFPDINPGGTINLVTKKPLEERRIRGELRGGSYGKQTLLLDMSNALTPTKKSLYRLNIGYDKSDGFRDNTGYKNLTIAPALTFKLAKETVLNIEYNYNSFRGKLDRGTVVPEFDYDNSVPERNLSQPTDYYNSDESYLYTTIRHRSGDWEFNLSGVGFWWKDDASEHHAYGNWSKVGDEWQSLYRYYRYYRDRSSQNARFSVSYSSREAKIPQRITLSADTYHFDTAGNNNFLAKKITTEDGVENMSFSFTNPEYGDKTNDILSNYVFEEPAYGFKAQEYYINSLSIYDWITPFQGSKILLGLKYERLNPAGVSKVDSNDQDEIAAPAFIPRVGVSQKIGERGFIFASYAQGLTRIGVDYLINPENYRPAGTDITYENSSSRLFEIGTKIETNSSLSLNLTIFNILKRDVLVMTYEDTEFQSPYSYRQVGEQHSSGVELEAVGEICKSLILNGNYTYNPTKIDNQGKGDSYLDGNPTGAPKHQFQVWLKWSGESKREHQYGVATGIFAQSKRIHTQATADASGAKFFGYWPSYSKIDMSLFYKVKVHKFSLIATNIANTNYWVGGNHFGQANPGEPIAVKAIWQVTL